MKTFILGVGAHKAGTTWLYNQIQNHKSFKKGLVKEMRFFKGYGTGRSRLKNKKKLSLRAQEYIKLIEEGKKNPEKYFEYFENLASDNSISHVGEITPIYCSLEINELEFIRDNLKKKNFDKKIVFLVRDPLKRILSQFSSEMKRKHFFKDWGGSSKRTSKLIKENPYLLLDKYSEKEIINLVKKSYKSNAYKIRTQYEIIIPKLFKVFEEEEIFIDFFEDMFNDEFRDRFIKFSNLKGLEMNYNEASNVGPKFKPLPEEIKSEIINFYKDTYLYMNSKFPNKTKKFWSESLSFIEQ